MADGIHDFQCHQPFRQQTNRPSFVPFRRVATSLGDEVCFYIASHFRHRTTGPGLLVQRRGQSALEVPLLEIVDRALADHRAIDDCGDGPFLTLAAVQQQQGSCAGDNP